MDFPSGLEVQLYNAAGGSDGYGGKCEFSLCYFSQHIRDRRRCACRSGPVYLTKPVRIVVSIATGAGTDVVPRLIGLKLTEAWGQPIVVDARLGASGRIGAEATAKSSTDV